MAFEGQEGVVTVHTMAVIADPDEPTPGSLHCDRDGVRFSVKGILRQFFYDRGGALDHLTSRNAIGQIFR